MELQQAQWWSVNQNQEGANYTVALRFITSSYAQNHTVTTYYCTSNKLVHFLATATILLVALIFMVTATIYTHAAESFLWLQVLTLVYLLQQLCTDISIVTHATAMYIEVLTDQGGSGPRLAATELRQ